MSEISLLLMGEISTSKASVEISSSVWIFIFSMGKIMEFLLFLGICAPTVDVRGLFNLGLLFLFCPRLGVSVSMCLVDVSPVELRVAM